MEHTDSDESTTFDVVLNHEEQYSIWPSDRQLPAGWSRGGFQGPKADCLRHIEDVWTDMRPKSLHDRMARAAAQGADPH
jgi:MbtH protein